MLEQPDGTDLLRTARDVLLRDVLPHLPEALKFQARMIANAIAIAMRDYEAEPGAALERLRDILAAPDAAPDALLSRLAREIRAGQHDAGTPDHGTVAATLVALTRLRCSVSAPKALGR